MMLSLELIELILQMSSFEQQINVQKNKCITRKKLCLKYFIFCCSNSKTERYHVPLSQHFVLITLLSFYDFSDTSAGSGGGSDDEGSNAATEGSTLRTSPAEPVGSGGSESGGSGVDSIGGASGRSSTYGDQPASSPPRCELKLQALAEQEVREEVEDSNETENTNRLHGLR